MWPQNLGLLRGRPAGADSGNGHGTALAEAIQQDEAGETEKSTLERIAELLVGCISVGDNRKEALRNIREAVELYLESVPADTHFSPDAEGTEMIEE